ncbi:MAG: hypothetical protein JOZ62_20900, partial [Acidobacteriaceae bacterium]|nr:hypothetical protein [Acidobacteriaceae bacterium]
MSGRSCIAPAIAAAALLCLVPAQLFSLPTVGPINVTPSSITAGVSTSVTVTVQITDPTVLPGGVNLLREDASGNTLGIVGLMHDDGLNGDAAAGDGIYTLVAPFAPSEPGQIFLQVSAAFNGIVERIKSPVFVIAVNSGTGQFAILDFSPKSGPRGTLVRISLDNFTPVQGSAPQITLTKLGGGTIAAPVSSYAANTISFVIPAGAGTGTVTVSSGGQSTTSTDTLSVTTSSVFTMNVGPPAATLLPGQKITYSVTLSSANGFNGLAALAITGVPDGIIASFTPTQITANQNSILTLSAPATQSPGSATLTISAAASIEGQTLSQSATVTLQVSPVTTSFVGRTVVDDTQETPIAGVTVKFLGKDNSGNRTPCSGQTVSDAGGNFFFA